MSGHPAIKVTYTTVSAPNPVTGKRVTLIVDRYYFWHGRQVAVLDLGTPQGVDNVDAYRLMSESFAMEVTAARGEAAALASLYVEPETPAGPQAWPALHFADVFKIFRSGDAGARVETVALRGLELEIAAGELVAVIGPSRLRQEHLPPPRRRARRALGRRRERLRHLAVAAR